MKKKFLPKIQSQGNSPGNYIHLFPFVLKLLLAPQVPRRQKNFPSIAKKIMNLTSLKPNNKNSLSVKDLTQNYLLKIKTTMQIDLGRTVNFVRDVENQIKELNLPSQKYMDPETNGQRALKNITPILQKDFPLMQCDPASFRKHKYFAKDFFLIDVNTSQSSKNANNGMERHSSLPRLFPQTVTQASQSTSRTEKFKSQIKTDRMKFLDEEIEKASIEYTGRSKNGSVTSRRGSVETIKVIESFLSIIKSIVWGKWDFKAITSNNNHKKENFISYEKRNKKCGKSYQANRRREIK